MSIHNFNKNESGQIMLLFAIVIALVLLAVYSAVAGTTILALGPGWKDTLASVSSVIH